MIRRTFIAASFIIALQLLLTTAAFAGGNPVRKATVVDQGVFGIFQNGRRLATETFTIRQYADSSVTSSELREEVGAGAGSKIEQSSELTLFPNGNLSRYEWKQKSPVQSSATVEPNDQFLVMHSFADGKSTEQPFFLTADAFVLDDYFFSTREVLLWRYMASSCKPRASGDGCDLTHARFAALIPRRHTSAEVTLDFKGFEDMPLNGQPQHLRHFLMQIDGQEWHMWLDSNQKLLRISIPDTNTEILRQ